MSSPEGLRVRIRNNVGLLGISTLIITLSLLMGTDAEHATLFGWELPPLCVFKAVWGRECPGCGLTRSFIFTAHGQVQEGFRMHWIGPLLWVLTAAQIPFRSVQLWRLVRELRSPAAPASGSAEPPQGS